MFNDFTPDSMNTLDTARHVAVYLGSDKISPEHLFLAIARRGKDDSGGRILFERGIDCKAILAGVINAAGIKRVKGKPELNFDGLALKVFEGARESAKVMGSRVVGNEHLVCGFAQVNEGNLPKILESLKTSGYELRDIVYTLYGIYDLGD